MFATTFKRYNVGFITIFLTCLNFVQCINFGNIFDGLSFSLPFRVPATAEHCTILKNRRKCLFTTKNLEPENNKVLKLVVNADGRTIKCNQKIGTGTYQWYGSCDGDADDANFITRVDDSGKKSVYGSIHVGNEICRIGPNINGQDEITCIPRADFKAEDDARLVPDDAEKLRILTSDTKFGFIRGETHVSLRGKERTLFDDSGDTIDTMVVWTKTAECGNAGLLPGCSVNATTQSLMRGLIDLAIAETNTAFALSGIFTAIRLVHAYRDPDYVEGNDFYTSLEHLTDHDDGYMDSVHSKRALYGADIVQMIGKFKNISYSDYFFSNNSRRLLYIDSHHGGKGVGNSCGIAWSGNPSINYMFSATNYACATGYYSFGHELGHNFGLYHDHGSEQACNDTTAFNFGYRHPNAEYRTILSYDCKVGECDQMPKDGCPRIQRFSNSDPVYKYNGKPIGNSNSDNARHFNDFRATVASYFPAMDCQSDVECNDNNASTNDICNTAKRVCVFSPVGAPTTPRLAPPTAAPSVGIVDETVDEEEEVGFFQRVVSSFFHRVISWFSFGSENEQNNLGSTST